MEWKSSLTNVQGRGWQPSRSAFPKYWPQVFIVEGEGEREFWNAENLWGLSLAQTPHYTPLEALEARAILEKNFLKVSV